jgi:hypothetical protein
VCSVGVSQISRLVESLARLEQVRRQIRPANVATESVDDAASCDDRPAGFPEGAALVRAQLRLALDRQTQRAVLGFDLAHDSSLRGDALGDIGRGTDSVAAFY